VSGGEDGVATSLGRYLRRIAPIAVALLLIGLLAYGLTTQGSSERIDEALADGEAPPAPPFALPILDAGSLQPPLARSVRSRLADGRLGIDELAGTPFVLNLWASWCVPCREEAPVLERGWRRDGDAVLYVGLDMQDLTDDARAFLDEFGISYPTIRDPGNEVARSYGATGIPETYFVSADGGVVGHVIGVLSEQQLADGAEAARRGQLLGTVSGGARRPQR
jgi:cytochrome c biogenesis protein CcmG/thiol:disulfide interchange protein DsbE